MSLLNRYILFKAKRLDNGEWVMGGSIIQFLDDGVRSFYMPQFNEKCICEHDEVTDDILKFENTRFYKVDGDTICQYTGLTDKNGNKMWENDVVNYKNESVGYDKNGIVKFGEYHSGFDGNANHIGIFIEWNSDCLRKDIGFWTKNRECEVIGNIFDNPELLGGYKR